MKYLKLLTFAYFITIFFSCNKTKIANNKILGKYSLIEYTVDGVDSLNSYRDSLGVNFYFHYDDLHEQHNCIINGYRPDGKIGDCFFLYVLCDNKNGKTLLFKSHQNRKIIGPFGGGKQQWDILKLTNHKIQMKTMYNNKEYYVFLN